MLDSIKKSISEPLENEGYKVYSVTLEPQGEDEKIVINIERVDGEAVSIDDCVKATKIVKPIVDEIDVNGDYLLEVGSKGIDEDGK